MQDRGEKGDRMSEEKIPEESKLNRRRFLSAAAMTVAAAHR
jgi:hypothetical protein